MTVRIDEEIRSLERRIAWRRHRIEHAAVAAKSAAVKKLVSPVGLASAAGLGFLASAGFLRRKRAPSPGAKAGKLAGVASLIASVGFALLRAQFGSPAQMAQLVLSKLQKRKTGAPGRVA